MSVVHPFDLVTARSWAGRIASRTEQITPAAVYSNRLGAAPPAWKFRNYRTAWREMRERATTLVHDGFYMAQLDLSSYYPSVDLNRLVALLVSWGCEASASIELAGLYEHWQRQGLQGLPVGTEDAGVLGNAYLLPLDWRLLAVPGLVHLRWMDDVYLFHRDFTQLKASVGTFDDEVGLLELDRSLDKSSIYESQAEALAALDDKMLTSLYESLRKRPWSGRLLHRRFIEHILEADTVEARRYRAIIYGLLNRRDPFGASHVTLRPELFNIDPSLSADYVRLVGLGIKSATNGLFMFLEEDKAHPVDETDARDLHALRTLERRVWGRAEGQLFEDIALDFRRRGPIRAWAVACWARTPTWRPREIVEMILEEPDIYLRMSRA